MAWKQVEDYRQLEQEYQFRLGEYERAKADYEGVVGRGDSSPDVVRQFAELEQKRAELDDLHKRILELRQGIAAERELPPESAKM